MTGRGVNATGRSTGQIKHAGSARRWKLEEQFVAHPRSLREHPGWHHLSMPARRVLDFIEMEHMKHAGTENGNLMAPYAQLVAYGVSRRDICPALDLLEGLGFVRRTEKGERQEGRPKASRYALTWLPTADGARPTSDYLRVTAAGVGRIVEAQASARQKARARKAARKEAGSHAGPNPTPRDIDSRPQMSTGLSSHLSTKTSAIRAREFSNENQKSAQLSTGAKIRGGAGA